MMTDDQVRAAMNSICDSVYNFYSSPKVKAKALPDYEDNHPSGFEVACHLLYMVEQVNKFLNEGKQEKAMRWLGFAQGVAWSKGWYTIKQLKHHNKPK